MTGAREVHLLPRCANFAIGELQSSERRGRDDDNEQFCDRLHEIFQVTLDMLQETMEARGFDFEEIPQARSFTRPGFNER